MARSGGSSSRSSYTNISNGVISALLVLLANLTISEGFALQLSTASIAGGRRASGRHQAAGVGLLFSEVTVGGDAGGGGAAVATESRVKRKVVKPWPTKAQETVDYSNVEAM